MALSAAAFFFESGLPAANRQSTKSTAGLLARLTGALNFLLMYLEARTLPISLVSIFGFNLPAKLIRESQTLRGGLMSETKVNLVGLSADIVSAYVSKNNVTHADLSGLIASVHASLSKLDSEPEAPAAAPLVPAVSIRKSVTPDAIICLEDGKSFKSLKRHLRTSYDLTPEQYRTKWGLPVDYPMVAPAYAEARSALAKSIGLGRKAAVPTSKAKRASKSKG